MVSVPTSPRRLQRRHDARRPCLGRLETTSAAAAGGRPASVVRDLLVLPPACSLLARVTAMHNYSSCPAQNAPSSSWVAAAAGRGVYSAPQSPSMSPDAPSSRPHLGRRCFSTPASPSPVVHGPGVRRSGRRRAARRRPRPTAAPAWEWSGSEDSDGGGGGPARQVPVARRAHHNVLERRRRDHLKYSFEALRAVVPGTATDVRMPKVAILRRARDHARHLATASQKLCAEYSRLNCLHQRLRQRLALLTDDDPGADETRCTGTLVVQAAA